MPKQYGREFRRGSICGRLVASEAVTAASE